MARQLRRARVPPTLSGATTTSTVGRFFHLTLSLDSLHLTQSYLYPATPRPCDPAPPTPPGSITNGSGGIIWNKDDKDEITGQDFHRVVLGYVGIGLGLVLAPVLCLHPGVAPAYRALAAIPVAVGAGSILQIKLGA